MIWVSHQRQPTFSEKSKPIVRWGHKANGSQKWMAGLPEKKDNNQEERINEQSNG
jgi:hypothetical protein